MKEFIKKLFINSKITSPFRLIVREAVRQYLVAQSQDIDDELQRRARSEAADFALAHLTQARPFRDQMEMLKWVFLESNAGADELVLEFGVWKGRTLSHIARLAKGDVHGFDSFEGLPEKWRWHYETGTFALKQLPNVAPNARLWKGWFNESLPPFLEKHPGTVAFLHIDCDLYSSTRDVLTLLGDRLRPGSILLFDEYFNYPGWRDGEHKAFEEFVAKTCTRFEYIAFCSTNEQVAVRIL